MTSEEIQARCKKLRSDIEALIVACNSDLHPECKLNVDVVTKTTSTGISEVRAFEVGVSALITSE